MNVASEATETKFAIREYRPADFESLWKIDQGCFPPGISYSQMELNSFLTKRNAIALVAQFQSNGNGEFAAAGSDPQIAGFVVAHSIRHKYGRILTLDIVAAARRYGLGTHLMLVCEERLHALGCRQVYLETAVNNEAALRLYHKLGYKVLDILPAYYASHALDAFQMGKRL